MRISTQLTVIFCALISISAFAGAPAAKKDTMEERIKPVGSICMAGEDCAAAPVASASTGDGPRSGQAVYDAGCASCHNIGAAGAPKFGEAAQWSNRIAKGVDTLYTNAYSGFNAMPAKGLCFDCSEEEIKVAVDYILDNSK